MRAVASAIAILSAAAVVLGSTTAANTATRTPSCDSGRTIVAGERLRIFRIGAPDEYRAYYCILRSERVRPLGDFSEDLGGVVGFTVAGRYVAHDRNVCSTEGCGGQIVVVDTRRNRRRASLGAEGLASDIAVKGNGSVAWIRFHRGGYEVRALDASGEALLDTGEQIEPNSLALSGSRLYWFNAGQPRTAQLR